MKMVSNGEKEFCTLLFEVYGEKDGLFRPPPPFSTSLGVRTLSYTIKQGFSLPRNPCGSSKRFAAACAWHAACGTGSLAHMYHLPSVSYRQLTSELSQVEDRFAQRFLRKEIESVHKVYSFP